MPDTDHGDFPLYLNADNCEHPEPPEPDGDNHGDGARRAWDAYCNDHPHAHDINGERICIGNPDGTFCPACTEEAQENEDLPAWEYVACRKKTEPATA